MGALKIDCLLSESQMNAILKEIESKLYESAPKDIDDFDDEVYNVRVIVEYTEFLNEVSIKTSQILDHDWDMLIEDTAVLTSRLRKIVENYNEEIDDTIEQQESILAEYEW